MKKIKEEDIYYLVSLLKSGLNIKDCLYLLKNKQNKDIFEDILKKLDEGYRVEEALSKYLDDDLKGYFIGLSSKMSFVDSLDLALKFKTEIKEETNLIIKSCLYPFILLFVSISALYFFDLYGLDNIFNLLKSFDSDTESLIILRTVFRIFIYIFYYGLLIITLFIYFMTRNKRIIIFYRLINKLLPNNLFKSYYTSQFISLFQILLKEGYKTKESLNILRGLKAKPIISVMAYRVDEDLLMGEKITEAIDDEFFDELLKGILKISGYVKNFEELLAKYINLNRLKTKNKMKKLSVILEGSIYLFIGIIVIFVYQILFMPLKALGGI